MLDGEPLTVERIKQEIGDVFTAHDCVADELIVSHGGQSAVGHEMGSGPIAPGSRSSSTSGRRTARPAVTPT